MALGRHFTWGASTSAYQIEGATGPEYGRGPSIWEKYFEDRPHLDHGAVACGHYERMREDVQMMKRMGLTAYRFSIAWPRVMPDGHGRVNEQGLAFYDSLIDELLANGIEPYVTLYHWDLPLALSGENGGWTNRHTCQYFADYAALCVKRYGDRVKNWATFNELEVIVAGYIGDGLAPGLSNPALRVQVGHNLLVAHGLALRAMRAINSEIKIGIVLNLVPVEPANDSKEAALAARSLWERGYAWYLDGLFKARYPDVVLAEAQASGVVFEPGDMALISQSIDMLGVNWYLRLVVDEKGAVVPVPGATVTQMGWEINASALSRMLIGMGKEYKGLLPPIYITENGAAIDDVVGEDGHVHDPVRTTYIYDHLCALEKARRKGLDIRGYFAWSLMDNLEWSLGFAKTFGIVHVDRSTLKRTVKDSGRWYAHMIARDRGLKAPKF
ncbi:MAG: beta-glucosidase [Cyanobacteria bacterium REEB67]|nr:beta-glucosidase [Cyanobacteria bacterium REEB67]